MNEPNNEPNKEIHVVDVAQQSGPPTSLPVKVFCTIVWLIVLYGVLSR